METVHYADSVDNAIKENYYLLLNPNILVTS